jgi:hypothetical protein
MRITPALLRFLALPLAMAQTGARGRTVSMVCTLRPKALVA